MPENQALIGRGRVNDGFIIARAIGCMRCVSPMVCMHTLQSVVAKVRCHAVYFQCLGWAQASPRSHERESLCVLIQGLGTRRHGICSLRLKRVHTHAAVGMFSNSMSRCMCAPRLTENEVVDNHEGVDEHQRYCAIVNNARGFLPKHDENPSVRTSGRVVGTICHASRAVM